MSLKNVFFLIPLILFSLLQFSCSLFRSGFNRGELSEQIGVVKPVYDDNKIKEAFAKKANLPKPFKLGIYFKEPVNTKKSNDVWRWTEQDKTLFEEFAKELKSDGLVSDTIPIMSSIIGESDIKSLRYSAAKYHADALLVVSGAGQIDRYINKWGWTYTFLLPAFFVPGSEADTLFMTNAALWDVRNEYLYITAEAEANLNNTYIATFGKQDKELFNQAKTEALNSLKAELKKMIKGQKL